MFKHLFKLIWNKKKSNFLLMLEMMISFLVMFAVFTIVVYYYRNYIKPMGIESERVWAIGYNNKPQNKDSLPLFYETLRKHLLSMPQVEAVSFSTGNIPFSNSMSATGLKYNGKEVNMVYLYTVDDGYSKTMGTKLLAGRWFSQADDGARYKPIVINESLKNELFGNENPIGKNIPEDYEKPGTDMRVVGVVQDMKDKSEFSATNIGMYKRPDSTSISWLDVMLVKVRPGADMVFEGKLYKSLSTYIRDANIEIRHLSNMRANKNKEIVIPMLLLFVVAAFLVINVALGLFGVLWYNINKRKGEIGLRRAIGAPGKTVSRQLVWESLVLATIALLAGVFFAVQFPLLNIFDMAAGTYLIAIALSVLFIYLLAIVCALYPGRQAAAIYPAVALHED